MSAKAAAASAACISACMAWSFHSSASLAITAVSTSSVSFWMAWSPSCPAVGSLACGCRSGVRGPVTRSTGVAGAGFCKAGAAATRLGLLAIACCEAVPVAPLLLLLALAAAC